MSPTEKDIKIIALSKLINDHEAYVKELEEMESQMKQGNEEAEKNQKPAEDVNAEIILEETRKLISLAKLKIKEVVDDLRSFLSDAETNETVQNLLSNADNITKDVA